LGGRKPPPRWLKSISACLKGGGCRVYGRWDPGMGADRANETDDLEKGCQQFLRGGGAQVIRISPCDGSRTHGSRLDNRRNAE
jgi:hypothetical protein